jgi:O-antigen ligase
MRQFVKQSERGAIYASFILACIMLGGASREGFLGNFLLQVASVPFLVCGLYRLRWRALTLSGKTLLLIVGFGVTLVVLQFVPLPVELWRQLPGRAQIATELQLLGALPQYGFVSLSVHESLTSAMWLLPALGFAVALVTRREIPAVAIATALVAAALVSLVLGLAQFGGGGEAAWYLYDFTNRGVMVGFFANANHMATLLLVSMPFIAALMRWARERYPRQRREIAAFGIPMFALTLIGVGLVGSLTGYALLLPVALSSAMIVWTPSKRFAAAALFPALLLSGIALALTGSKKQIFASDIEASLAGREQIRQDALGAAIEFFPVGTGLGTFEEVHRRYEDRDTIGNAFINHAHNDYLEMLIELGAAGALMAAAFLTWWAWQLFALLRSRGAHFGWAGWIACGVILVHSAWDYPLRTAALSTVFALSCVLAARSDEAARSRRLVG